MHIYRFCLVVAVLLLATLISRTSAGRILAIIHHPGYSHFKSFSSVFHGLAERSGHNVTVVGYYPAKNPHPNYHDIVLEGQYPLNSYTLDIIRPATAFRKGLREFRFLQDIGRDACKAFFESGVIDRILKIHAHTPFDLIVTEVFNTDCILGVVKLLQKPYVAMSSCVLMPWHYNRVGLPDFPSFLSSQFAGFVEEMTFAERLMSYIATKGLKLLYKTTEQTDMEIIQKHLNITVDIPKMAKEVSLILVNQHYSLHGSRPLPTRVVEIGGINVAEKTNPLSKDLTEFLNKSKNGVIFISWGSLVNSSSIPADKRQAMVKAFARLKEDIIWKWDSDKKPIDSNKFLITKWVQQKDILCHPKVKLFWSHGGLLGTSESVHCAVPMVITPMYGDQYLNAEAIKRRKMGEILPYEDIAEETVFNMISKVLQPSYSANAKYVSDVFRNRQNPPLDTALWWIEHVLNTAGSNLTYSPSVELNWFVYYSLDVISTLIGAFILILAFIVFCIKKICKLLCCRGGSVADAKLAVKKKKKTS